MKCRKCGEEKELTEFRKDPTASKGFNPTCKACLKAAYADNPKQKEAARRRHIKATYGIDMKFYDQLYEQQKGRCAICHKEEENAYRGRLYIDHCHDGNGVRGLLCQTCNSGIGMFKNRPELLDAAIAYLNKKGLVLSN